jgi:predicted nuclease with TOPRIM domain
MPKKHIANHFAEWMKRIGERLSDLESDYKDLDSRHEDLESSHEELSEKVEDLEVAPYGRYRRRRCGRA